MDLILFLAERLFICEDAAMGQCGSLEVGGVLGGMAGVSCDDFQLDSFVHENMNAITQQSTSILWGRQGRRIAPIS